MVLTSRACYLARRPCRLTAATYVVGYTLMNDVLAREYVLPFVTSKEPFPSAQAWERNVLGKNYPTFARIGLVIVTKDELPSPFTYHMPWNTAENDNILPVRAHFKPSLGHVGTTIQTERWDAPALSAPVRCLIPGFDGAPFTLKWKEAIWARFCMGAPQRLRPSVERYSIVKRA